MQGTLDIIEYFIEMVSLWQELDLSSDEEWSCIDDNVRCKKRLENERVYEFLIGLNHDLGQC